MRKLGLVVAFAAMLPLGACGGGDSGSTSSATAGAKTVTVAAANGTVAVPVTSDRIWALDEITALQLLALGIEPDNAGKLIDDPKVRSLLTQAGVRLVGPSNVELVAAADPELIVGLRYPDTERLLPQLERIAPVVTVDSVHPWEDQLAVLAAATGRRAEASEIVGRVHAATEDLARRIAETEHAGATVSVLAAYADTFYAFDNGTLLGTILTRLGFERPAAQVNDDDRDYGFTSVSEERLGDHEGDIVISLVDDAYTEGRSVLDSPVLDTRRSLTAEVDYLAWFSTTPLGAWWILRDLEAILLDGSAPATADDAPELWAQVIGGR